MDTLSIARELRAADLPQAQAEAIASAIGRAVNDASATKADLENTRLALKADIDAVRSDLENTRLALKADIEALRVEVKAEIDSLRFELKADIENLRISLRAEFQTALADMRSSLLTWFIGTQVAVGALIVAIVKL